MPSGGSFSQLQQMAYSRAINLSVYSSCERCSTVLWFGYCHSVGLMVQEGRVLNTSCVLISCLCSLQSQIVLGGTAQTTTLGTATAVQTGTAQRTVQGATAASTAATVRLWLSAQNINVHLKPCALLCMYIQVTVSE